jgi:hypothetical protein
VRAASAIRWLDRPRKQSGVAAKCQGGGRKPGRIEAKAAFLLGEAAGTADIARVQLREKPRAGGAGTGIGTLWRASAGGASNVKAAERLGASEAG